MANLDLQDDLTKFENPETANRIPVGWALLFWGLILWGAYYLWAYTPALGGWSQAQDAEGGAAAGSNITATILFTAIPTAVALGLWIASSRRTGAQGPR
jgi:hypothetical protein